MTDQIQSSPVGAPDSSYENALAQWQELPLFLFRKRIKSLALLRYGDTSVRLSVARQHKVPTDRQPK